MLATSLHLTGAGEICPLGMDPQSFFEPRMKARYGMMFAVRKLVGCFGMAALVAVLGLSACSDGERFIQQSTSEFFLQDFNPPFIDVLWVVDDRSPMYRIREHLNEEATRFFQRLDQSASQYRMGIISADTQFSGGELKPSGNPVILTKNLGTVDQRAQAFSTILSQVINLKTGAESNGLAAGLLALNGGFFSQPNVPLVIVYISDADDHSDVDGGGDAIDHFKEQYTSLKDSEDLIQVYSINYLPLDGAAKTSENRCATLYNADIDKAGFEDRYFRFAETFGGDTSDVCGGFANDIDLTGLRLKELPTRFVLERRPDPSTIDVGVTRDGQLVPFPDWTYDAATNEIVFEAAPPAGTTIQVTYRSA